MIDAGAVGPTRFAMAHFSRRMESFGVRSVCAKSTAVIGDGNTVNELRVRTFQSTGIRLRLIRAEEARYTEQGTRAALTVPAGPFFIPASVHGLPMGFSGGDLN
jgi:hypothetical protein